MDSVNSNKLYRIFIGAAGLIIIAVLALLTYYYLSFKQSGELQAKPAYAYLQGVEDDHRNDKDRINPVLIDQLSNAGYIVLGLPTGDKMFPRTWIVLNKTAPDGTVLMVPSGLSMHVSCDYITTLQSKVPVNPGVFSYLHRICK